VSKVDAAEAFAPWHREAGLILALLASLVACTAAAGLVLWQRTEKAHYRTLYRTEQARRQAEAAHRTTLLSIGDAVIVTDPEGRVALLNPPAETLTGWPSAEAAGRPLAEIFRIANERTGEPVEDPVARVRREGVVVGLANHTVLIARDGTERPIADSAAPIRDGEGALAGAVLVFRDQTEERAARRAVEAARQELQALFDITPALICLVDRERKVVRANRAFDEARGAHDQARDRRACGILGCLHALDDPRRCGIGPHCMDCALQLALADTLATGATHRHVEFSTVLERQGKPEEIAFLGSTCRFPSDGSPRALLYLVDITTHKQAEADREKLREQLTQAQKMEAIGRLAGGIAHDFNNLLMGILNYLELCRDGLSPDHPIRPYLDEIRQDAERSTALVRQLMTFARKQPTSPAVLDLNQAVAGALGWLRRLIGEQIELAWHPGEALGRVALDPAQLDQLLTNLLANARDAIGGPGTVTIETQNAVLDAAYCARYPGRAPGEYVVLAVTDNGRGMDAETKRRVFEPYFTTKAAGQGGGLGLATVDGIVQQNGGIVAVYSEPDRGATFRLYFPRCQDPASPRPHPALREIPRGRGELVLLVEDERAVRLTCHRFLEDLGYRVLAAATPAEALALAEESAGPLHLLLTDVVLPELTGRALAADLLARHPGLRTLYMSGYTANAIHHQGVLEPGIHFLQKPFTRADLAQKVREVLDEG
jgi:PAS domain S-box-containing protein